MNGPTIRDIYISNFCFNVQIQRANDAYFISWESQLISLSENIRANNRLNRSSIEKKKLSYEKSVCGLPVFIFYFIVWSKFWAFSSNMRELLLFRPARNHNNIII